MGLGPTSLKWQTGRYKERIAGRPRVGRGKFRVHLDPKGPGFRVSGSERAYLLKDLDKEIGKIRTLKRKVLEGPGKV